MYKCTNIRPKISKNGEEIAIPYFSITINLNVGREDSNSLFQSKVFPLFK